MAPYGAHLFVTWKAGTERLAALVDTSGAFLMGQETIPAEAGLTTDLTTIGNGEVGWAYSWGGASALRVVRVRRCE